MDLLIESEQDRQDALVKIAGVKLPFTLSILVGKHRTLAQNKLQRQWMKEIGAQMGVTPEEARGYCKLRFGVPILREDSEVFRVKYDEVLKPLSYPDKIKLMMEPLDLPVTRLMTIKQKAEYLDRIHQSFSELGYTLTDPDGGHTDGKDNQ